jgi:hypothetical protein
LPKPAIMGLYITGPLPCVACRKYSVTPAPSAGLRAGGASVVALVGSGAIAAAGDAALRAAMTRAISGPVSGPRR